MLRILVQSLLLAMQNRFQLNIFHFRWWDAKKVKMTNNPIVCVTNRMMQMTTHCWTELSRMSNKSTAKLHLREIWTSLQSYRPLCGNATYYKLPKQPYYVDYVNTVNFFRLVYCYTWWIRSTSSMINSNRYYLFMISILTAVQCSVLSGNWVLYPMYSIW